jgi:hypothetical protein
MSRGRRNALGTSDATIGDLIAVFVDAVTKHGASTDLDEDAEITNREFARYTGAMQSILDRGDAGRDAIRKLMRHPNPWVRMVAAGRSLEFAEPEALETLEEVSRLPGFVGFNARVLLRKHRGEFRQKSEG